MRTARLLAVMAAALVAATIAIVLAVHLDRQTTAGQPTPASTTTQAPQADGDPLRVTIPAIGVDASLVAVGLRPDGAMQTPAFGQAAWYDKGPRPGQPGPAVVLAHVDSKAHGPDVFYRLRDLKPGDRVTIRYRSAARTFAVTSEEETPKTRLPAARIWADTSTPVLRLITCGGAFDRHAGSYLDNIIVYADQLVT
jgi:sortase (surface protein transpeptidase)